MSKSGNTCKKSDKSSNANIHMRRLYCSYAIRAKLSGLMKVDVNGLKEAGQLAMLLCVKCLKKNERDNFIKRQTIDKMNEKIETETQEIIKKLQIIEKRIIAVVDTRVDNAIKTTCGKVDKSNAEAVAVQPRNVGATSKAHSKELPDLNHNIRKSIQIQGVPEDPDKAESFVPTTNEVNDVLNRIGVTTQITELKRLGKFNNNRKKPRTLLLTFPTEHDARLVLAKARVKKTVLTEKGDARSKEDAIKEKLCLKNKEN